MRYLSLWFRHLTTDWMTLRRPELKGQPFVFAIPDHGRLIITATNPAAEQRGITPGMTAADAKAILPELLVLDEKPGKNEQLLRALGKWCIRYAPLVSIDLPDGLIINASGCSHLWGGEKEYLKDLVLRLRARGCRIHAHANAAQGL